MSKMSVSQKSSPRPVTGHPGSRCTTGHHDSIVRYCGSCTIALISRCPCSNPPLVRGTTCHRSGPEEPHHSNVPSGTYMAAPLPRARDVPPMGVR
ncbi:hypothetical protein AVEN_150513-1 [Araneus ventricosus]|uniref:Uncharacterized protein n=1 Tax=Araneus ventricosus TaxID=182803 RepID=A0A4Y2E1S8_ARAVE|nr:hypothetical protein AVEN_150513-1 [Araneus ventricosus]